ncbi:MAG: thiol-disulfide oxidoreductase DCC family protein [Bacteroidota bacterium]
MNYEGKSVVIFDGHCNLCNRSVNLIIRNDPHDSFLFTANQHEEGRAILKSHGKDPDTVSTLYLLENNQLYERSTASLKIAAKMGFPFSLTVIGWILPKFMRDAVYGLIARNRYRLMGRKDTCRMPSPAERAKFI